MIKNPNWQKATSWLFTSVAENLNSGRPSTNPASGQSGTRTRDRRIAIAIASLNKGFIPLVCFSCHEHVASTKRVSKEPRSHARIKERVRISLLDERKKNGLKFWSVSTLIAASWDAKFMSFWIHFHFICSYRAGSITGRVFEIAKVTPIFIKFTERFHVHVITIWRNYPWSIGIDDRLACRHQISKCLVCTLWSDLKFFFGTCAPSLSHILMAEDQRERKEDDT